MRTRMPKLRHHKHTNRAVVTIEGRDVYLGRWGSPNAEREYRRVLAEHLYTGRVPQTGSSYHTTNGRSGLTVSKLIADFRVYASRTMNANTIKGSIDPAMLRLDRMYGHVAVTDFEPPALRTLQQSMLRETSRGGRTLSRNYVNRLTSRIKGLFKWGVAEGLVPAHVWQALTALDGIRMGAPGARETNPIRAVADETILLTLEVLPPVVADMVRVQRLTGMRPGELCRLSVRCIDMSGDVWVYAPHTHKNAHRGMTREIPLGPRAQAIIRPYLSLRAVTEPLFSPKMHADRGGPRATRVGYDTTTYARAIRNACNRLGIEVWSPNQLRHARATELRRSVGLDGAGAVLGHRRLETTQIYAERSRELAVSIAGETG